MDFNPFSKPGQFAQATMAKLVYKSALNSLGVQCVWCPVAWAASLIALLSGKPDARIFAWFFFGIGCLPLLVYSLGAMVCIFFDRKMLRSEEHVYKMAKLESAQQGRPPKTVDLKRNALIKNPAALKALPEGEPK